MLCGLDLKASGIMCPQARVPVLAGACSQERHEADLELDLEVDMCRRFQEPLYNAVSAQSVCAR